MINSYEIQLLLIYINIVIFLYFVIYLLHKNRNYEFF
jgi:hypothetical protein